MNIDAKLKHYYVTGVLIEPGKFVDRFGHSVEFSSYDQFVTDDVVPIFYEHGGPIVGFATRFYTSNCKLCFDGYVFDSHIVQVLMSTNPGVSVELIKSNGQWIITGMALTKHPAIERAGLYGVIAMSSIKGELEKFLSDNGIDNAANIAVLVEKFLAQFKYPSPELKNYEIKLSEAAKTIEELNGLIETKDAQLAELNAQLTELSTQLDEKIKVIEAKEAEISELAAKCQKMEEDQKRKEEEMKKKEMSQKIDALVAEIKEIAPDVELSALPEDVEHKIASLEALKATLTKLNLSKPNNEVENEPESKLEFSASDCSNEDIGNWDAAIKMYLSKK